jgi:hypothetical protein
MPLCLSMCCSLPATPFLLCLYSSRSQPKRPLSLPFSGLWVTGKDRAGILVGVGWGEAHLHQVPEVHLPILRAADHVCVPLTQAAIQLVLLVFMACVPGGGQDQRGFSPTLGRERGKASGTQTHSPSSSPVSLSSSRKVESRLDTRVHCPSRLKQVQVMGTGVGEDARQVRSECSWLPPPSLPVPQPGPHSLPT